MKKLLLTIVLILISCYNVYAFDCDCIDFSYNEDVYAEFSELRSLTRREADYEFHQNIRRMRCVIEETRKLNEELKEVIEENKDKNEFKPRIYPYQYYDFDWKGMYNEISTPSVKF